jgi:hypothetical protein
MAGKLQNEDHKSLAELTGAGGSAAQLLNDSKIYVTAGGINKQLSQAITDGDIGGGGGSKNYIGNAKAESGTTGWATYADAAASSPVDGTGGSPNITWTQTSSSPLEGTYSFLLTKDAANRQGEGVSYDFTIDLGDDNGGVFVASCSYMPTSGTFSGGSETTDSDVTVYIVSKEFGTVIQPSYYKLQASVNGKAAKSTAYFQLPVSAGGGSARQFRLCYHVATVSTAAYTVKFDEVSVGPKTDNSFLYGTGKLPTIQKFTTAGGPFTYNRPDGVAYIKVKIVGGGGGGASSGAGLGLPGGTGGSSSFGANLTAGGGTGGSTMTPGTFSVGGGGGSCTVTETATIKQILACTGGNGESGEYYEDQSHGGEGGASALGGAGTGGFGTIAGTPGKDNTGGGGGGGGMNAVDSSGAGGGAGAYLEAVINSPASTYQVYVGAGGSAGPSGGSGSFAGLGGGSGVVIVEEYYTPTDAGLQTSSLCSYTHAGGQTINTSWATILFGTKTVDDSALYNTGTGVLTFAEAGDYTVFAGMLSSGVTLSTSQTVQIRVRKNGSDVLCQNATYGGGVIASVPCFTGKTFRVNAGDYIEIQEFCDVSTTTSAGAAYFNYFSVVKQNSSQVSPSEKIAAKYTSVTADAIGTSLATLTYPTKVFDTHNAYSSGFFTAPSPGKYFFKASVITNPVTLSTGQSLAIEVRKNSSTLIDSAQTIGNGASNYWSVQTSGFIELNYGETVDVQVKSSVATSVGASASYNTFEIFRI